MTAAGPGTGLRRRPGRSRRACRAWTVRERGPCSSASRGVNPGRADGLARLVLTLGVDAEVRGCIEMMSGAVWVRDQLALAGWEIRLADARKAKAIAPLACKTDRVHARVLADLVRRDLVPSMGPVYR
jgi:hypothetical protein